MFGCALHDTDGRARPARRAGNYSQWLEARAARLQQEGKEQSGLQRAIAAELDFVRSQAKGQQKKGKARMRRYDELVDQARALPPLRPQPPAAGPALHRCSTAALNRTQPNTPGCADRRAHSEPFFLHLP